MTKHGCSENQTQAKLYCLVNHLSVKHLPSLLDLRTTVFLKPSVLRKVLTFYVTLTKHCFPQSVANQYFCKIQYKQVTRKIEFGKA